MSEALARIREVADHLQTLAVQSIKYESQLDQSRELAWFLGKVKVLSVKGVPWSEEEIIKGSHSWAKQHVSLLKANSFLKQRANVKLWGILDGLTHVQEKQGNTVLTQTDSLEAIKAIQDSVSTPSTSTLIKRIHHFLKNVKDWVIEYIAKEENKRADRLAK
ncbi:hypothetical protein Golax_020640 [Gossypium laxum]|uniref:RNase H type-1 domain-containing protein n=1 Tax=Gossypium laxum TaxID=34288 RepID=A0A7J9B496_9ROSI|nr:hypothetical protein [Gossypium laxum]